MPMRSTLASMRFYLGPDYGLPHFLMGRNLTYLGLYIQALAALDKAIMINSEMGSAHYWRGKTLIGLERWEEALLSLDIAWSLLPNEMDVMMLMSIVEEKLQAQSGTM